MKQSKLSQYKGFIIVFIILMIIGFIAIFYYSKPEIEPDQFAGPQPQVTATLATITSSPISLLSPTSPSSPIAEQPPTTYANPDAIQAMIDRGIQLQETGDFEGALGILDEILMLDPNNFIAYNARGSVYTSMNDFQNAIDDYSETIKLEPSFPHAFYNRGRVYSNLEQYDKAITDLQKSIELAPNEFGYRANGNIGLIYHKMGEYDKALEAFNESMPYDDTKADVFYFRGETYTALEGYNAAIADYQAAIQRFSRYDLAYQSLGYAYYKTGQLDQAMDALNQATTISPTSSTAHLYKMLVYLALNDISNAQSEANQGISSISESTKEDQQVLFNRVLADLNSLVEQNPTAETQELIKLIETQSP